MENAENIIQKRIMRDYMSPFMGVYYSSIVWLSIQVNNFEIKSALLQLIQQEEYGGFLFEDPNLHIMNFLQICDTMKPSGATTGTIHLGLFPFSLKDKVRTWLQSQPTRGYEAQ